MAPIPEHFTVDTQPVGDATIVELCGALDMTGTLRFEPRVDEILASGPGTVVFDLRGLTFVDSTGLAALVGGYQRLADAGVPSRFVRGSDDVQRIFAVAGFDEVLPFEDPPAN